MKDKLTLRNVAIWFAAVLALIAFILSFTANFWFGTKSDGVVFNHIIWGADTGGEYLHGHGAFGSLDGKDTPAVLPMIGFLLIILSAVGAVVVSFVVKNEKVRKIIALSCAGLMLLGGVFAFITLPKGGELLKKYMGFTVEQVEQMGYKPSCPAATAGGILAIIGAVSIAVPQFIKDIKFVK